MNLGDRLKQVSIARRISLSKMGPLIGLSKQAISDIVNGKTLNPRSNVIYDLAEKLEINADWLMTGKGEMVAVPEITTQSTDMAVKELIREVNFLREQLEKRDKQFDSLLEILKQEDNGIEPPVYVMHPHGLPEWKQFA